MHVLVPAFVIRAADLLKTVRDTHTHTHTHTHINYRSRYCATLHELYPIGLSAPVAYTVCTIPPPPLTQPQDLGAGVVSDQHATIGNNNASTSLNLNLNSNLIF